jgi:UDP-4-amino-4,6-dideoxy-N-acetyl-beta-L-altrosamine N-acetyltransferase
MTGETSLKLGKLRTIMSDELALMLSWRNAPAVRLNMYTSHEISLEEHLGWWEKIRSQTDQKYFMYEHQGSPLGIVSFNGISSINQNSYWAFYASPEAAKGTGSRMEYLALEHAFSEIGLHKLSCEVIAFNTSVIKLHEKFGFKIEGVLRDQHKANANFFDVYRLGILRSEWQAIRDAMLIRLLQLSKI